MRGTLTRDPRPRQSDRGGHMSHAAPWPGAKGAADFPMLAVLVAGLEMQTAMTTEHARGAGRCMHTLIVACEKGRETSKTAMAVRRVIGCVAQSPLSVPPNGPSCIF